jgi:DNA-binding transcriptional LysR family regulator
MSGMDVRHMRQVLAIHRHGSFAKAAEELGIAQPTLSKSVARLEDELGLKLFDRSGSGAKVTPMGALIVGRAEKIIVEAERLARDVELVAAGQIGEVRVGFGPAMREVILPRLTVALADRYPDLRLHMVVEQRRSLLHDLMAGRMDILIMAGGEDVDAVDVVQTELMRELIVAVAAPHHPLAGRGKVSIDEFAAWPNASPSAGAFFATPTLLGLADPSVDQTPAYVTNDFGAIRALVDMGRATYVGAEHVLRADIRAGNFAVIDLDWRREVRTVAVMTRAARHSPILQAVVEQAQAICASIAEDGAAPPRSH